MAAFEKYFLYIFWLIVILEIECKTRIHNITQEPVPAVIDERLCLTINCEPDEGHYVKRLELLGDRGGILLYYQVPGQKAMALIGPDYSNIIEFKPGSLQTVCYKSLKLEDVKESLEAYCDSANPTPENFSVLATDSLTFTIIAAIIWTTKIYNVSYEPYPAEINKDLCFTINCAATSGLYVQKLEFSSSEETLSLAFKAPDKPWHLVVNTHFGGLLIHKPGTEHTLCFTPFTVALALDHYYAYCDAASLKTLEITETDTFTLRFLLDSTARIDIQEAVASSGSKWVEDFFTIMKILCILL